MPARRPYVTGEETRLELLLRLRALEMGLKRPDRRYVSDLDLSIAAEEKAAKISEEEKTKKRQKC